MIQHLAVTVVGKLQSNLSERLTGVVAECGCNIEESRMATLGEQLAMLMLLSGNWNAVVKVEDSLKRLGEELGLSIHARRTDLEKAKKDAMPYAIDVVCGDRPGVVNKIIKFISDNEVQIRDLHSTTYMASQVGTKLFSMHLTVYVPVDLSVASLRNDFLEFCDQLNLDAVIEPVK